MVEPFADPGTESEKPAIHVVRIWKDHEPIDDKGNYREVEWVEWAKKGTNGATTLDKVSRLSATKDDRRNPVWDVIAPVYERWSKGQEEPVDGTPLSVWPAVTAGQAEQLRGINIRTVEDMAMITDGALDRAGPGARTLRDKAKAFLAAREDSGTAEELVKLRADNADLRATVGELTASVKQLTSELGLETRAAPDDAAGKTRRKPGKPKPTEEPRR